MAISVMYSLFNDYLINNTKHIFMKKTIFTAVLILAASVAMNAQVVKSGILDGYNPGDVLEKVVYVEKDAPAVIDTWCGGYASNPVEGAVSPVVGEPLVYEGYDEKGPSIVLGSGFEGDVKGKRITVYTLTSGKEYRDGTLYLSFLVDFSRIGSKSMSQFVGFCSSFNGGGNRGTVYVKRDESDKKTFYWGVKLAEEVAEWSQPFEMNRTYLVVLKLDYNNQCASLFVDPDLSAAEPEANITAKAVEKELKHSIRGINLRDGNAYDGNLGNFRITRTWESLSE